MSGQFRVGQVLVVKNNSKIVKKIVKILVRLSNVIGIDLNDKLKTSCWSIRFMSPILTPSEVF